MINLDANEIEEYINQLSLDYMLNNNEPQNEKEEDYLFWVYRGFDEDYKPSFY